MKGNVFYKNILYTHINIASTNVLVGTTDSNHVVKLWLEQSWAQSISYGAHDSSVVLACSFIFH